MPFSMLEILIAHHTPFRSRAVEDNISAVGILNAFRVMPTTDGGTVFPKPLKAPAVTASVHMNSCDNPNILRYVTPYRIVSSSGINTEKIGLPANIKSPDANSPKADIIISPTKYPLKTLDHFFAPKFCPMKALIAV